MRMRGVQGRRRARGENAPLLRWLPGFALLLFVSLWAVVVLRSAPLAPSAAAAAPSRGEGRLSWLTKVVGNGKVPVVWRVPVGCDVRAS